MARTPLDRRRKPPFLQSPPILGHAAFSPSGAMLAYSQGDDVLSRHIYVRNVVGGDAIQITNDGHDDASPSWSSDGAHIAYIAFRWGEPCRIMVAGVPAGSAREVGHCNGKSWQTLSWRPNRQRISLFRLADATENRSADLQA